MDTSNNENCSGSAPYQIICPNCHKAMEIPENLPESPLTCPFCHQIVSDDYEIRYRPSRRSKPFRMIALGILIVLGFLILLAAAVLIFAR